MVAIVETKLIVPDGKKTGCLLRASRLGELCPMFSERIKGIPVREWSDYIGKIKLSPSVEWVLDQDGVGSCATEATAGSVMIIRKFKGQPLVKLNPWFIYYHTSGGRDKGSNIDTNLAFARDKGVAPESVWSRSEGWRARPSDEAYDAALENRIDEFFDITSTEDVGTALLKGFPVVYGWQGHSCVLLELLSETHALYLNSWGKNWNGNGLGTIRLSSINFGYGAWAVRSLYQQAA